MTSGSEKQRCKASASLLRAARRINRGVSRTTFPSANECTEAGILSGVAKRRDRVDQDQGEAPGFDRSEKCVGEVGKLLPRLARANKALNSSALDAANQLQWR
jgi:hypothetical protein